ncbi:DUF1822 family protein [Oscillatoria salina]|uniref:DUF1822 family protein n=1 Tax=Oscillatoria salina TaxID=331517 RepID=UPI0013BD85F8|nr:DUF1822 family protein [Oscillatoria salina]MBZ8180679.1 DUF1822 family protein [Oscillatoria salina IIICB1]NET87381.1 DUF1822 family protein [Kamptonema sp. SIO1D9]
MNNAETPFFIPLKISQESRHYAQQFAREQVTSEKSQEVFYNTLAVCAVYSFLEWMELPSNLNQSESWNSVVRRFHNVADLVISGIGKIECRPVLSEQKHFSLPPEVTEDRIGCVLVKFEPDLEQVKLLGFIPATAAKTLPEQIKIEDLQPLEDLTEYLDELQVKQNIVFAQSTINLSKWLANDFGEIIKAGWQTVQELLDLEEADLVPVTRFRSRGIPQNPVIRCKQINLGRQSANEAAILIVFVWEQDSENKGIRLQLRPSKGQMRLPTNLLFSLLDESGNLVEDTAGKPVEFKAKTNEPRFDIWFPAKLGEGFLVKLALNNTTFTESFSI